VGTAYQAVLPSWTGTRAFVPYEAAVPSPIKHGTGVDVMFNWIIGALLLFGSAYIITLVGLFNTA